MTAARQKARCERYPHDDKKQIGTTAASVNDAAVAHCPPAMPRPLTVLFAVAALTLLIWPLTLREPPCTGLQSERGAERAAAQQAAGARRGGQRRRKRRVGRRNAARCVMPPRRWNGPRRRKPT